jgi:hypothetical protein
MKIAVDLHPDPLMHLALVCRHTGLTKDLAISRNVRPVLATRPPLRESGAFSVWSARAGDADALVDSFRNVWT